jgi:hypothetical protein
VRFGKPLTFERYAGLKSDRLVLRAVTDEIMYAVMRLSGQEYVDQYAQRVKQRARLDGSRATRHHRATRPPERPAAARPAGTAWPGRDGQAQPLARSTARRQRW